MMKKMKYIIRLSLALGLSLAFIVSPEMVYASKDPETLGDLRKIYEEVLAEKRRNDNKSEQAKNEIKQKEADILTAKGDLTEAEALEEEVKVKIEESNQKIEENKKESEKVLVYMQQVKNKNVYVEYVTGSSSMTELVTRIEAIKQVSDYIQITLKNLETEIDKNEKLKIELENKQKELEAKINNYKSAVSKLYTDLDSFDELNDGIEKRLEHAKEEYETAKSACQKKGRGTADSVRLNTCYDIPYNGQWLLPLTSGYITSRVGYRTAPMVGFHTGIDIGVREGTPVYAAAAGRVAGITVRSSCGGNKLYINVTIGGNNYTTYYLHLLRFKEGIKVGDVVTQDTIIGYVGGGSTAKRNGGYDSCTTGAHLHYGVQNGWYDSRYGIMAKNVIVPPGMKNSIGWTFKSRYDLYTG